MPLTAAEQTLANMGRILLKLGRACNRILQGESRGSVIGCEEIWSAVAKRSDDTAFPQPYLCRGVWGARPPRALPTGTRAGGPGD